MNKIASHNTMSYLPPKHWWLYPFRFIARCQSKTIQEQYEKYGIKCFDLRVCFDESGNPHFAHGLITYKGNVYQVLNYLNSLKDDIKVRLILEKGLSFVLFYNLCRFFERSYKNITFFEGVAKDGWVRICSFQYQPTYDQKVSSMTGKKWDDWCPWLYAKLMNKKNVQKGTDKNFLFMDFVNIK